MQFINHVGYNFFFRRSLSVVVFFTQCIYIYKFQLTYLDFVNKVGLFYSILAKRVLNVDMRKEIEREMKERGDRREKFTSQFKSFVSDRYDFCYSGGQLFFLYDVIDLLKHFLIFKGKKC